MAYQQPTLEELFSNDPPARPEPVEDPASEEAATSEPTEEESQPAEEVHAETPAAESDEQEQAEPAAEPDTGEAVDDDFSDIPESIRRTLEAKPDDAQNWRGLRSIAKDAQSAAKEAAEAAATLRAEKARLEAEVAAYRAAQTQPAPAPQPAVPAAPALPDPELDPAGFAQALIEQRTAELEAKMRNAELNRFEAEAVKGHGQEAVETAFQWAQQRAQADPAFGAQFGAAYDPWEFVVREHRRYAMLSEMGDDPQAYIRQREEAAVAAAMAKFQAEHGQATEQQVAAEIAKRVPRSLAKVPGATGSRAEPVWNGPPPLDSFVGPQTK